MLNRKISINTKLILLIGILISCLSIIIASALVINEKTKTYEEHIRDGKLLSLIMAENSEFAIYTEERKSLQNIIRSIGRNEDVVYVAIHSQDRVLLQETINHAAQIPEFSYTNNNASISEVITQKHKNPMGKDDFIDFIAPVISLSSLAGENLFLGDIENGELEVVGYLQIGLSMKNLNLRLRNFLIITTVFTILFILIGIIITSIISRKITSPLKLLGDATLEIAKGNLDHHIELRTRDEVSDLAQSFNQMTESLKSSRNAAEAYVKERLETNRKLKDEIVVRNMAEASLIKTQEQLQHLLSSTPAAIYRKAVPEMALSYISDNVQKLTGYAVAAFMNDTNFWIDHIHSEDAPKLLSSYKSIYHTDSNRTEYRFLNNDGSYIWLLDESYLKRDGEGNASDIFGYCIDITERKKLEEQLQYDAMHDPLTDLPNRSLFIDRLNVCLARMHRHPDYLFAVLFLDLDRFKNINDSLGHVAGDKLLKATARKLERCVRLDDSLSRLGGDEFAIILNDMEDASDAIMIAERILIELNTPFILDKHEVFITTSIGITIGKQEYQATEQIIRDSDTAMYVAKTKGGKCYKVFDQSMHVRAVARLHMEMDLRKAVEQQLFTLHYQPIVSAVSEKIVGFEALLRYEHRTKGLISPMEFIPIAEETGLILPIGKWVLRQACETLFSWQKKYPSEKPLTMSINVSSKQLNDEFIDDVKAILLETGLNPEHLILEITETILMQDINFINQFLAQLKAVKVKLHVDDFGTGYSSLSYLQSFPIDALKIDRSFIKNIDLYREKYNIVKTISSLAQNLNLEMVAEGVETVHQLKEVMKLKCNYIQGYLFSKPLAALEAEKLLQKPNPVQSMRI